MAREMYLVGVTEEELRPDPKPEPPKTPRDKWANFWYHYKWAAIGCAFAVVVLAVLIGQAVTRDDPDYTMILATQNAYPDTILKPLEMRLAEYGEDLDGDGKVEVNIISCALAANGGNTQAGLAGSQMLQVHLAAGDVMLFAFDKDSYNWLNKAVAGEDGEKVEFLQPLETTAPGLGEDGVTWHWADDSRYQDDVVLSKLPDLYFCVRLTDKEGKTAKMQRDGYELLMHLISDTRTAAPTAEQ